MEIDQRNFGGENGHTCFDAAMVALNHTITQLIESRDNGHFHTSFSSQHANQLRKIFQVSLTSLLGMEPPHIRSTPPSSDSSDSSSSSSSIPSSSPSSPLLFSSSSSSLSSSSSSASSAFSSLSPSSYYFLPPSSLFDDENESSSSFFSMLPSLNLVFIFDFLVSLAIFAAVVYALFIYFNHLHDKEEPKETNLKKKWKAFIGLCSIVAIGCFFIALIFSYLDWLPLITDTLLTILVLAISANCCVSHFTSYEKNKDAAIMINLFQELGLPLSSLSSLKDSTLNVTLLCSLVTSFFFGYFLFGFGALGIVACVSAYAIWMVINPILFVSAGLHYPSPRLTTCIFASLLIVYCYAKEDNGSIFHLFGLMMFWFTIFDSQLQMNCDSPVLQFSFSLFQIGILGFARLYSAWTFQVLGFLALFISNLTMKTAVSYIPVRLCIVTLLLAISSLSDAYTVEFFLAICYLIKLAWFPSPLRVNALFVTMFAVEAFATLAFVFLSNFFEGRTALFFPFFVHVDAGFVLSLVCSISLLKFYHIATMRYPLWGYGVTAEDPASTNSLPTLVIITLLGAVTFVLGMFASACNSMSLLIFSLARFVTVIFSLSDAFLYDQETQKFQIHPNPSVQSWVWGLLIVIYGCFMESTVIIHVGVLSISICLIVHIASFFGFLLCFWTLLFSFGVESWSLFLCSSIFLFASAYGLTKPYGNRLVFLGLTLLSFIGLWILLPENFVSIVHKRLPAFLQMSLTVSDTGFGSGVYFYQLLTMFDQGTPNLLWPLSIISLFRSLGLVEECLVFINSIAFLLFLCIFPLHTLHELYLGRLLPKTIDGLQHVNGNENVGIASIHIQVENDNLCFTIKGTKPYYLVPGHMRVRLLGDKQCRDEFACLMPESIRSLFPLVIDENIDFRDFKYGASTFKAVVKFPLVSPTATPEDGAEPRPSRIHLEDVIHYIEQYMDGIKQDKFDERVGLLVQYSSGAYFWNFYHTLFLINLDLDKVITAVKSQHGGVV